eukprot:9253694-Heterocapsa_arctica.AAC.1
MANQNIYPTTDMATMIKVEDLMITKGRSLCVQHSMILSVCGQVHWNVCSHADCYGCYCKRNAIADFMTNDIKGETIIAIGEWRQ